VYVTSVDRGALTLMSLHSDMDGGV